MGQRAPTKHELKEFIPGESQERGRWIARARTAIPAHIPPFVQVGSTTSGVVAWSDTTGVIAAPAS